MRHPRARAPTRNPTPRRYLLFFFFNDTATTEIYPLSLHDALPIFLGFRRVVDVNVEQEAQLDRFLLRSEEHTSELQSRRDLVCRLLLEKKREYNQLFLLLGQKVVCDSDYLIALWNEIFFNGRGAPEDFPHSPTERLPI